mmetsp:Transcript_4564/g.6469  ORF Transcript_4564/g.6469 Transcript_4564/m.6469 type:complete len:933 (+) Transcript_4564:1-2799(+)
MKFNYKLHRLCGSSYGTPNATNSKTSSGAGGNVIYTSCGNILLSPVSNRVQVLDLLTHASRTLTVEARSNIRILALSPDDRLLLIIDSENYALLVNFHRSVILHRFKFHGGASVKQCIFSPCGKYFGVTAGRRVDIWHTPGLRREFAPFVLHRSLGGFGDAVLSIDWSQDSSILTASSRDGTCKVWTVHSISDKFVPMTLSGHKSAVIGVHIDRGSNATLQDNGRRLRRAYTVSADGAVVTWTCQYPDEEKEEQQQMIQTQISSQSSTNLLRDASDAAVDFFGGHGAALALDTNLKKTIHSNKNKRAHDEIKSQAEHLPGATWKPTSRHYFHQDSLVTCSAYSSSQNLLTVGFASGLFALYELPSMANVHTLSISNRSIRSIAVNNTGEWLAFGCPSSQQLLVWEWRSETYIIKQKGHAYGMTCMAYSPDGIVIATGGEDGSLKLWNVQSGFCYCTLSSHNASITQITFAKPSVVITSSLDGTVRAHDLHRYRNFRTYTAPTPVQFVSLAVDPAGEVVVAGTADPFRIYTWNITTAKLLDVLSGHNGPISSLVFHPLRGTLVSASWDGTAKVWDLYKSAGDEPETLKHSKDVVCCAIRPDGVQMVTGTIGGTLSIWNLEESRLLGEIDGRKDISGGRKVNDRMTSDNNAASRYFTSVCYSADGSCILAGGNSKFVCIYEISQKILLKKFQVSFNRSLDGVLDELNSKDLGEGGPINRTEGSDDEVHFATHLPGAKRADDGMRKSRVEVQTAQVAFSSTGREWAAVSNEGLHVYSLDDDMVFDPISLTEAITPGAVQMKLNSGDHAIALLMSLHLNEYALVNQVIEETPYASISHVVKSIGPQHLENLMQFISKSMIKSPHVEFYMQWCLELLKGHGIHMEKHRGKYMRAFRAMHRSVQIQHDELKLMCDQNRYTLDFMASQSKLIPEGNDNE